MGRFTDPHPLTCSFFTPYLHCLMFRQCRLPQPSPNPFSEWRIIFSIEGYPMPQIVAFAGPAGPFFLFLPFFFPPVLSPAWMGLVFSHPGSPLSRIRPQLPHTPPTGPVWGFGGVAPLPGLQNRTRVLTGPSLFFLPQNQLTPPPKGGGAGYRFSWVCWVCPARPQLPHTAPTGLV